MSLARTAVAATLGVIVALAIGSLLQLISTSQLTDAIALYVGVFTGGLIAGLVDRSAVTGVVVGAFFYRAGATAPVDALLRGQVDGNSARVVATVMAVAFAVGGCLLGRILILRFGRYLVEQRS